MLLRHVLPNIIGPAAVRATANFGSAILTLAGLSFLGLGMQATDARIGRVLAIYLLSDPLRDVADPRTR